MNNLKLVRSFLLLAFLLTAIAGFSQDNYDKAKEMAEDTTGRYEKNVFCVDRVSYQLENYNGEKFHTTYILHGEDSSTTDRVKTIDRVIVIFKKDIENKKARIDSNTQFLYIWYPESHFNHIQNLLLNSKHIWVQYFVVNNDIIYADVHGRLITKDLIIDK
jgi:hypothetical protein